MASLETKSRGLAFYSRFVLTVLVLPFLFIAGVQLFILSGQTETYFAWTFASTFSAAFIGAGYWSAMFYAIHGTKTTGWQFLRTSMPAALTATVLLAITTFLHLDKFHLNSPLLITRFVTWVWILVYVFVPPILLIAWIIQSRLPDAKIKGTNPLPTWLRVGYVVLTVFTLTIGIGLFIAPESMSNVWAWSITPLAARAISPLILAFGVACVTLAIENDIKHGIGTYTSLFAFCILQFVVLVIHNAQFDSTKPLAIPYLLFLLFGVIVTVTNLLANKKLST